MVNHINFKSAAMNNFKPTPSTNEIEMYKLNFDAVQSNRELRLSCLQLATKQTSDRVLILELAKEYYEFAIAQDKPNGGN